MLFKKRWIAKAISWKAISAVLGAVIVYFLTGEYKMSVGYLAIYMPISLALFIANEKVWHVWKLHKRSSQ